ncbi:MAG: hypothetical protein LBS26_02290 [Campylobacteraceae bacterium]|jgi:hypothetical protein|nr:hypothetical protein [Campylobacteraceae bacterium]
MSAQLLGAIVIAAIVIVVMIKQINRITDKLDTDEDNAVQPPRLYANFASLVQDKIRSIRIDIESKKDDVKFVLLEEVNISEALEKLSDMIRRLVFFETMIGMKNGAKNTETQLFEILNELDVFITERIQNGETLADETREELASSYEQLKNSYMIESM